MIDLTNPNLVGATWSAYNDRGVRVGAIVKRTSGFTTGRNVLGTDPAYGGQVALVEFPSLEAAKADVGFRHPFTCLDWREDFEVFDCYLCDQTFLMTHGNRLFGSRLVCDGCAKEQPVYVEGREQASRADVERDEMNEVRR